MKHKVERPRRNAPLVDLVSFYLASDRFLRLSPKSQKDYESNLRKGCSTSIKNNYRTLGNIALNKLRTSHFHEAYDTWLSSGVRSANYRAASMSACLSYGVETDVLSHNPIQNLRKQSTKPRRVRWEKSQVIKFLDTAYSDFKWRSIGLIVQMSYEWAQRVGDMRTLTWNFMDLDEQRIDLVQSKRNAQVHLPISDELTEMLKQQKQDFGFQQYVVPKPIAMTGAYTPYRMDQIDDVLNEVKEAAGLPRELTAMDLRRTAITEMAEAGVDAIGIRQVSGHSNLQSVTPYLVNTYSGASAALAKRRGES